MIQLQHFGPPLFHDIDFKRFWRKYHTKYRFNISYKYKCLLLKWITNWLCNLLEFEKKVTPCTQEYGLTSLVETDQWHCREGLRLYLPKLKEAVIQTIDRQTQRQTDDRDSLLWIRSEMQKQIKYDTTQKAHAWISQQPMTVYKLNRYRLHTCDVYASSSWWK